MPLFTLVLVWKHGRLLYASVLSSCALSVYLTSNEVLSSAIFMCAMFSQLDTNQIVKIDLVFCICVIAITGNTLWGSTFEVSLSQLSMLMIGVWFGHWSLNYTDHCIGVGKAQHAFGIRVFTKRCWVHGGGKYAYQGRTIIVSPKQLMQ